LDVGAQATRSVTGSVEADVRPGGTIGGAKLGWTGGWGASEEEGGGGGSYIQDPLYAGPHLFGECWSPAIEPDCLAGF
jgi:hypothetical protein